MSRDRSARVRHPATSFAVNRPGGAGSLTPCGGGYFPYAFLNAAQRRFVASIIAFRPAALSFRFARAGAVDEAAPACFLELAISSVRAAAILARAAGHTRRLTGVSALSSVALGFNIW